VHTRHPDLPDEETGPALSIIFSPGVTMLGSSGHVFVYNKTKETFLAFRVKIADSFAGRMVGLLGKRSLDPDSGVWIVPANAIHTVGMLFSLDVVMIDKDFKVVSVKELVKPFRILLPKLRAESVIELPVHTVFRSRTEIGDELVINRYEPRKHANLQETERYFAHSGVAPSTP
jgi:uncharacterized membrane protein (UPF0127 family)